MANDVSKIYLSLNNSVSLNKKEEKGKDEVKKEEQQQVAQAQVEHKDPKKVLDAMELAGSQNKVIAGLNNIDPTKYLSPERIKDIQKSMGDFEKGVKVNADAINQEFSGLPESYVLELAAQMML